MKILKIIDCFTDAALCSSAVFGGLDILDDKVIPELFLFWIIILGSIRLLLFVFNKKL